MNRPASRRRDSLRLLGEALVLVALCLLAGAAVGMLGDEPMDWHAHALAEDALAAEHAKVEQVLRGLESWP
jgi:hypothetical protein